MIGVIFMFIVPSVGIAAGALGVVLLILFLLGVGRQVAERRPEGQP